MPHEPHGPHGPHEPHGRMSRNTLFAETAELVEQQALAAEQHLLRLRCPLTAATARPGQFVHLQCDPALLQRRPMSILRALPKTGQIEILYRVYGEGTQRLSEKRPGDCLELLGPIGRPFRQSGFRPRPLLIGGGLGAPPILFLAEQIKARAPGCQPLVLLGSEIPFPFSPRPSTIMTPWLPAQLIAAMPLLDDWNIASRLCSLQELPGCYRGRVTGLAREYLQAGGEALQAQTEIFACGPTAMNRAAAELAREFRLPCQLSLEERMACATGGCAGCTVPVHTREGLQMQRVCVDGPVFDAQQVFPAAAAP